MSVKEYASVRIFDVPPGGDRAYEYYVPPALDGIAVPGSIVTVSFGRGNGKRRAVVTDIYSEAQSERELKPLLAVSDSSVTLTENELELCRFMCGYTLCTFGEAVKTVIPSAALSKMNCYYSSCAQPSEASAKKLSEKALAFFAFICARERTSAARLAGEFGDEAASLAASLVRAGLIKRETEAGSTANIKYKKTVSLAISPEKARETAAAGLRSPMQAQILLILAQAGELDSEELYRRIGKRAAVQLSSLEKKGMVEVVTEEAWRNPYIAACSGKDVYENAPLSDEQKAAVDRLSELAFSGEARAALLHGVTGSGKTRVIKEMIDRVTASGRGVIVLVPEISLTPQTVGIFCSCYGERVAVLHSALSAGERADAWRRIRSGNADVVIGTRSAVFAPVARLGMIVIDEEQEHTYKSESDPKYLAHDIARWRCGKSGALMLLSSATPSVTSYYKAMAGAYTLVELKSRFGGAKLPSVVISDMRADRDAGNTSPVGAQLYERLTEMKKAGHQAIIFLNRRGYNSAVSCRVCGEAVKCPNCSVSLTYHTHKPLGETGDAEQYFLRRAESGSLSCHYCGYRTPVPALCPSCGAQHFRFMGCGTQQAQEELCRLVPELRVARMDMDTTSTKSAFEKILTAFRRGEYDVLLGTQMVTKGHDFPRVTLVGVMNADTSLFLEDFRAAERTFAMLTQVIGRAGRANDAGTAVIQTCNPESEIIKLAARQDYKSFYEKEIAVRRALVFPPFCDIALLTLASPDETLLAAAAKRLGESIKELLGGEYKDVEALVFGPFEAPVYKVQSSFRMRLIVKCRLNRRARQAFAELLAQFNKNIVKGLSVTADFNPFSL